MARQNRRDRWASRVAKAPTLHASTRLFLVTVLVKHMKPGGYVCVPRRTLARAFGTTERRVSGHIQRAKEGGWLVVLAAGYHGHTAEYEARFPEEMKGDATVTLSAGEKGDAPQHPSGGHGRHPSGGERVTSSSPQVVTTYRDAPETAIFPQCADAQGVDLDESQIKVNHPTPRLRVVNG